MDSDDGDENAVVSVLPPAAVGARLFSVFQQIAEGTRGAEAEELFDPFGEAISESFEALLDDHEDTFFRLARVEQGQDGLLTLEFTGYFVLLADLIPDFCAFLSELGCRQITARVDGETQRLELEDTGHALTTRHQVRSGGRWHREPDRSLYPSLPLNPDQE